MPYLGNEPAVAYTSTTKDTFSGDGSTTDFTMSKSANVNAVRVVVENVVQNPTVAYTCSGTTIAFTSAPPTGTSNIYVVHLGPPAATVAPPTTINNATTFTADLTVDDGADIITGSAGTSNFRAGVNAGNSIASGGNYNVTVGDEAGTSITTGDNNTFIGYASGDALTTSSDNTAVGKSSMSALTTGATNTAVGLSALSDDTQGSKSTAIGYQALSTQNFTSATDSHNTAVGYNAGSLISTGINNTHIGSLAGDAITTGGSNTSVGAYAMTTLSTGSNNVAVGTSALDVTTTGSGNTAVGRDALGANTTASNNTVVGYQSFMANTTGTRNVGVGLNAGNDNTTGGYNTFAGAYAGEYCTTGNYNTVIGDAAGSTMTTGDSNTFIGQQAGNAITTGEKNTIIGRYTGNADGLDIRTSDGNIVLSNGLGEYHIWIDTSGAKMMRGDGITAAQVGNGTATGSYFGNAADFYSCRATNSTSVHTRWYNSNGQVGRIETTGTQTNYVTSSDYRLKENVTYNWDATTRLKQLKPARFNFIADADTTVDGFLAHEAGTVVPEAVSGVKDGVEVWNEADDLPDGVSVGDNKLDVDGNTMPEYQGIDHSRLVPLLVKTIQELEARITALEAG